LNCQLGGFELEAKVPKCPIVTFLGSVGGEKQIRIDPNLCVGNQLIALEHEGKLERDSTGGLRI